MNITINSSSLAQELRILNQVVASKPSIPILSNVLIHADGTSVKFATTNIEVGLMSSCEAQVNTPGALTLPAKKLLSLVEQLPDGDVQLIAEKNAATIISGGFKSRLQTMAAEEYPAMPTSEGTATSLSLDDLKAMMKRVRFAVPESGKHVVTGLLLSFAGGSLAAVGTDGKKLAIATTKCLSEDRDVIVPVKAADALMTMAGDTVEFSETENHLFFTSGLRTLFSGKSEQKFPKYQRVIPQANAKAATVNRQTLAAALRRVGTVSEDNFFTRFTLGDGAMALSSEAAGVGNAEESVEATYAGEAQTVTCSWRAVLDFLEQATSPIVTFAVKDDVTPLLLTDGDNYLAVVVLMR